MNLHPTRTLVRLLCLIAISFLLILSCNKDDNQALLDAVLRKENTSVADQVTTSSEQVEEPETVPTESTEETEEIEAIPTVFESRTTLFSPIHDAYLENGKGYNHTLIRLNESSQQSYLMFDLSQIDSIGASITATSLDFVINKDDGNGVIQVFKGDSNNWTETGLSVATASKIDVSLGSTQQEYPMDAKVSIALNAAELLPERYTLILNQNNGDDLAFASKENMEKEGPKLAVTYNAPITAEEIVPTTDQNNGTALEEDESVQNESSEEAEEEPNIKDTTADEETNDDVTTEAANSGEETTEEEVSEELATDDETSEEATTEEESTQEETTEEVGIEEESTMDETPEETTPEETTPEETTPEATPEETTPEQTAPEQTAPEETTPKEKTPEETTPEETTPEETTPEETTPEETIPEETTPEETTPEETTPEATPEQTTPEQTTPEQTTPEETTPEETTPEQTTPEETTPEETTPEETIPEETIPEETIPEETTPEETTPEETTPEETTPEETTPEETTPEETTPEETIPEETTPEETTPEETTPEETTPEETIPEETTPEETIPEETPEPEIPTPVVPSNTAPITVVDASPASGSVPLKVAFTGSNSSDDKAITSYNWNFKDGSKAATTNTAHTFTEAGTYDVALTTVDEEGLNSTDMVTITVNAKSNEAPIAKASAASLSGIAPFVVSFTGSNSTDDSFVKSYLWDFKDGSSSNKTDPSHSFNTPGTYAVQLTVQDEAGLTATDTVTITVDPPANQAPTALVSANILNGEAPLDVAFNGSGSSDDNGIASYYWNIPGNPSTEANTTRTFDNPGIYDITLTVTDSEGLTDTADLTITVDQASVAETGNIPCGSGGGMADDTGPKVWCWSDFTIPEYSGNTGVGFSNKEIYVDSECYEKQVTTVGNQLKFRINPTDPGTGSWCSKDYNMRAEIRTSPWDVRHARGTEEWFGWSYTFGNDYVIDQNNQWLFWQVHHGVHGDSPQTELMVIKDGQFNGHSAGELYVVNNTVEHASRYNPTGIVPRAGQKLDIVVHAVWDTGSNGWLQVWINGQKVYDQKVSTIYSSSPWAGNAKWGIYKWPWAEAAGVQKSNQQGITHMETFMGPLRMITRRPGDVDYLKDSYQLVAPD